MLPDAAQQQQQWSERRLSAIFFLPLGFTLRTIINFIWFIVQGRKKEGGGGGERDGIGGAVGQRCRNREREGKKEINVR